MATEAYRLWDRIGRPWKKSRPIDELQKWAERQRIAVLGTIGNEDHLTADRPQDHTPFSVTEWPDQVHEYVIFAIDLKNVTRGGVTLGQAIERQARAGKLPWLKYMNHGGGHLDSRDLDGDGTRWEVYPSSDEHVHLSIRTDWIARSIGEFNPWEETVAEALTAAQDSALAETWSASVALRDGTPAPKAGNYAGGASWVVKTLTTIHQLVTAIHARPAASITLTDADREAIAARTAQLVQSELRGHLVDAAREGAASALEAVRLDVPDYPCDSDHSMK
jgi:hypothetical protein